jgi:hypothetical protein
VTQPIMVSDALPRSNGRAVKLLGVAGVVLVLALVVPKFLLGGSDDLPPLDSSPITPPTTALAPPTVDTARPFSTKDPFVPLAAGTAVAPTDPAAASAAPDTSGAVVPETSVTPVIVDVPQVPVAPAPAPAPAPTPRTPVRFGLVAVRTVEDGQPAASVRVDGAVFDARVGQDFAGSYRILSLDAASQCGEFLFGDQHFSLCQGEETTT